MAEGEPLEILLLHDRWATVQMLDACGRLAEEQFHRPFAIGRGSLHDTLTHVIAAMRAWTESLAGVEPTPRIDADGRRRTAEELRALLDEGWGRFAGQARRQPMGEMVVR